MRPTPLWNVVSGNAQLPGQLHGGTAAATSISCRLPRENFVSARKGLEARKSHRGRCTLRGARAPGKVARGHLREVLFPAPGRAAN